jgi:hypothetical protein
MDPNLETLSLGVHAGSGNHSKLFLLIDCMSVGVYRMQRNFEPMRKQIEALQRSEFVDVTAKVVVNEGFVEGELEALRQLACAVRRWGQNWPSGEARAE